MNIISKIFKKFVVSIHKYRYSKFHKAHQIDFVQDMSFSEAAMKFPNRDILYAYMHHYFNHLSPVKLREHRWYFKKEMRGYGEDAFHSMWWLLLREFHPQLCLEIGVYRGQVISLWTLISQILHHDCEVHGISPFTPMDDSVSAYYRDVNFYTDTLNSFNHFHLKEPALVNALSTDIKARKYISKNNWNLIYIDGSHDFEVVLADYRHCRDHLAVGGLLVLDDASLGTSYHPPYFSFAGHPGPSRVAAEFAIKEMKFLGAVGHNSVFQKP